MVHQYGKQKIVVVEHSWSFTSRVIVHSSEQSGHCYVDSDPQVRHGRVSFGFDETSSQKHRALVWVAGVLQGSAFGFLWYGILSHQDLSAQHRTGIIEPSQAASVLSGELKGVDLVVSILSASELDNWSNKDCISVNSLRDLCWTHCNPLDCGTSDRADPPTAGTAPISGCCPGRRSCQRTGRRPDRRSGTTWPWADGWCK